VARKKVSERFKRTARTAPLGVEPPMGHGQCTTPRSVSPARVGWAPRLSGAGLRACLPAAALESAVLPDSEVPAGGSPLAERPAATNSVANGRKYASSRRPRNGSDANGGRPVRGQRRMSHRQFHHGRTLRVVTQEKKFCFFLSPAGLLQPPLPRPRVGRFGIAVRLAAKPAAGPGPGAQVVAAQRSRGPLPAA